MAILEPTKLLIALASAVLIYKLYQLVYNICFHTLLHFLGPNYFASSHLPRSFREVGNQSP